MHNASLIASTNTPQNPRNARRARRGFSLIWGAASLATLMGFASFAVDYGRVQLVKAELHRAADAAARVGAGSLEVTAAQALSDARDWAKKNAVDGRLLTDDGIAVTVGHWNITTRTFSTTLANGESYNACRVVLTRPAVGPESVPLMWGKAIGLNGVKVSAECIAEYIPGINVLQDVQGTANPFLSGLPKGTTASPVNPHNNPDHAGDATSDDLTKRGESPQMVPIPVQPGDTIQFDQPAVGTVRHDPNLAYYSPDGQLDDIGHNNNTTTDAASKSAQMYNENGLADTWAPINALVGVFTSDADPRSTPTPANLDFRDPASRDFSQLAPKSKQIFFIGDGINSAGMRQAFVVPPGATKLYLATWDYYEWNNNAGYRTIKVQRPGRIVTVK